MLGSEEPGRIAGALRKSPSRDLHFLSNKIAFLLSQTQETNVINIHASLLSASKRTRRRTSWRLAKLDSRRLIGMANQAFWTTRKALVHGASSPPPPVRIQHNKRQPPNRDG